MKSSFVSKWLFVLFFLTQFVTFAQDGKIKIYQSKSGDGSSVIVFPNSPEPLMVMTGSGECKIVKTMAHDDWQEMSSATVVNVALSEPTAVAHTVKSPRDVATGQSTGKRQHKPYLLSSLTVDGLNPASRDIEIYSFSWGMSNSGSSSMGSGSTGKATYDLKTNTKRTMSSSGGCCSNGVCSITVSVDKKHTKTGHVTLLK